MRCGGIGTIFGSYRKRRLKVYSLLAVVDPLQEVPALLELILNPSHNNKNPKLQQQEPKPYQQEPEVVIVAAIPWYSRSPQTPLDRKGRSREAVKNRKYKMRKHDKDSKNN